MFNLGTLSCGFLSSIAFGFPSNRAKEYVLIALRISTKGMILSPLFWGAVGVGYRPLPSGSQWLHLQPGRTRYFHRFSTSTCGHVGFFW